MDNQSEIYRIEATELLSDLESALLDLESTPEDEELIGRIFRAMHTIKGSGSMFGYDHIAAFTHDIETTYDLIREGQLKVSKKLIDLTLRAADQIKIMLDDPGLKPDETEGILRELKTIAPVGRNESPQPNNPLPVENEPRALRTFWIRFIPESRCMITGGNPVLLLNELRALGTSTIVAHTDKIPEIEALQPDLCFTYWDILLSTTEDKLAIQDIFIFVEDESELYILPIDNESRIDFQGMQELAEMLLANGNTPVEELEKEIREFVEHKIVRVETNSSESNPSEEVAENQNSVVPSASSAGAQTKAAVSNIRVDSEKLDALVDLVGELVIVQERLNQTALKRNDSELILLAEETGRLIAELRDTSMGMRLLPIGTTFSKFKRLVRDLANEQGKEIVLTTEGAETELDKTVIERLNDPLIHIIRNSVDHGIEPSSVRLFSGKPRISNIHLSAFHSGSDVVIKISDDGQGLNTVAIRNKAIERGLITAETELTDKEIHPLIFQPGFSTAKTVSSISGRGVGMDVVKRNIEELRGSVSVDSKAQKGTTITLRLPLTLGIIEGLLVRIADSYFVLPLSAVEECVAIQRNGKTNGKCIANVRGEIIPYIPLRNQFEIRGEHPFIESILIAKVNDARVGFLVDEVIGEHQIVIKSLGKMYRQVEGLSGATILGDGTVALILDVQRLVELAEMSEYARETTGVV